MVGESATGQPADQPLADWQQNPLPTLQGEGQAWLDRFFER